MYTCANSVDDCKPVTAAASSSTKPFPLGLLQNKAPVKICSVDAEVTVQVASPSRSHLPRSWHVMSGLGAFTEACMCGVRGK